MAVESPDLEKLFLTFEREAFRLEMQPEYRIEPEWALFSAAQSGEIVTEHAWPEWLGEVRRLTDSGRAVRRLLATRVPPSAFFEFRLREYRQNADAGEDVRVVFTNDLPVTGDFWLFDDRIAAVMRFDALGRLLAVDVTEDPVLVSDLVEMKEDLLDWSEPADGYFDRYIGGAMDVSSILRSR